MHIMTVTTVTLVRKKIKAVTGEAVSWFGRWTRLVIQAGETDPR